MNINDVIRRHHTRQYAHFFEFASRQRLDETISAKRQMAKVKASVGHVDDHDERFTISEVRSGDEVLMATRDDETAASMDEKKTGVSSIHSFDQMFEALSVKFTGLMAINSEVKTLTEQVRTLEGQRCGDQLTMTKMLDEITRMKADTIPVFSAAISSSTAATSAIVNSDIVIEQSVEAELGASIGSSEKSFKAKMLLSLCNVDKVAQFSGEQGSDANEWLRDFVEKSELASATDEFRLRAAPMNFQGIAKIWYINHKEQLNSWPTFVDQFLDYFCPDDNRQELLGERLYTRRQQLDESALHFYNDVMRLCSKFRAGMSGKDRVDILLKGTRPEARDWVELRNPSTPHAFLKLLSEYERRFGQRAREPEYVYLEHVTNQGHEREQVDQHQSQVPLYTPSHQQQTARVSQQPHQYAPQANRGFGPTNSGQSSATRGNSSRRWQGNGQ